MRDFNTGMVVGLFLAWAGMIVGHVVVEWWDRRG